MINFYYDIIFKGWPLPNAALTSKYFIGKKYAGYNQPPGLPVQGFNTFLYLSTLHNAKPNLFTKNEIVDNLYYPIEVRCTGPKGPIDYIPKKTIKRLQKKHLKLLLILYDTYGYEAYKTLKSYIDSFKQNKITDITVVTDELNCVYTQYLGCKVISFDYNQVKAQAYVKQNKKQNILKAKQNYNKFNLDNFEPTKLYCAYDTDHIMHKLALCAEISYLNLPRHFNNVAGPVYNDTDPIIYDKFRNGSENTIIKDRLNYLIQNAIEGTDSFEKHQDSLVSLHTQGSIGLGNELAEETHSLHTDMKLWQILALGKPFIIFGNYQIMKYLNNEGYFTFPGIINESYDRISSVTGKAKAIGNELLRINENYDEVLKNYKSMQKNYIINREKFLSRDHLSRFINLYDNIQYR